jgi:hypothetical protein
VRGKVFRTEYQGVICTFELSEQMEDVFNIVDRLVDNGALPRRALEHVLSVMNFDMNNQPAGAVDIMTANYLISRNRDAEAEALMRAARRCIAIVEEDK